MCKTSVHKLSCWSLTGGKAYGALKSQQDDKLNSINEVCWTINDIFEGKAIGFQ